MRNAASMIAVVSVFSACQHQEAAPVRASLADGQVLSGDLRTPVLSLQSSIGLIQIPLEDVGEVSPTEAAELGASAGKVTVWLRDGSEFVGTWADPEMTVAIDVGGEKVDVEVPMDHLTRLQTRAGEIWTEGTAYRVRTIFGDDFLVDPEHTRIVVDNDLGTFAPFLSECASARPVGDPSGDWRVELTNGNVLVGPLADDSITFALQNGPEEITVPLTSFAWMERVWYAPTDDVRTRTGGDGTVSFGEGAKLPDLQHQATTPMPAPPRPTDGAGGEDATGWFSNERLKDQKVRQIQR